jgi:molybdenum cofactor cytidylyltransferase
MTNVQPVILAAGDSSRMGYPKALLPLGDDTFLTRILKTLATLEVPTARLILGMHESLVRPLLVNYDVCALVNPDPSRGAVSSIKLALENLDPGCSGCLIWPVVQPLVSAELVRDLIRLFESSTAPLALPSCGGKAGHPAIFGRGMMDELLVLPPDATPKIIVARHKNEAAWLVTEETGTTEDIDTPHDYLRLTGETLESALARRQADRLPDDE